MDIKLTNRIAWQIASHLNLGNERIPAVISTLGVLPDSSIHLMTEIRDLVIKLNSLEETLANGLASENFYDQRQRVAGILASQSAAIGRLGKILGETPDFSTLNEFTSLLGINSRRD